MNRYTIYIQNPIYSNEVFVWDREAKRVLYTTQYRDLDVASQQAAKRRCEEFLAAHVAQLELPFGD